MTEEVIGLFGATVDVWYRLQTTQFSTVNRSTKTTSNQSERDLNAQYKHDCRASVFAKNMQGKLDPQRPAALFGLNRWGLIQADNHLGVFLHVLTHHPVISPLQSCRTTLHISKTHHHLTLRQPQVHIVDLPPSLAKTPRLALHLQKRTLRENGSPT
jgi:hypothetical protein